MDTVTDPTEVIEAMEADIALPTLVPGDRCDGCKQPAVAVAGIGELGNLLFCGHHWRASSAAIKESGYPYSVPESEDVIFTFGFKSAEEDAAK